jgi:SAM-dependent methyltransferase
MCWFDRDDPRAVFVDRRREQHVLVDRSSRGGQRTLSITPTVQADFRALPFRDGSFSVVVFDPPHFMRNGQSGWMAKKYGVLDRATWRGDLQGGFSECFRVCRDGGTVVFKWNENEVALAEIIPLAPEAPLVGTRFGKHQQSHWLVFMKPGWG